MRFEVDQGIASVEGPFFQIPADNGPLLDAETAWLAESHDLRDFGASPETPRRRAVIRIAFPVGWFKEDVVVSGAENPVRLASSLLSPLALTACLTSTFTARLTSSLALTARLTSSLALTARGSQVVNGTYHHIGFNQFSLHYKHQTRNLFILKVANQWMVSAQAMGEQNVNTFVDYRDVPDTSIPTSISQHFAKDEDGNTIKLIQTTNSCLYVCNQSDSLDVPDDSSKWSVGTSPWNVGGELYYKRPSSKQWKELSAAGLRSGLPYEEIEQCRDVAMLQLLVKSLLLQTWQARDAVRSLAQAGFPVNMHLVSAAEWRELDRGDQSYSAIVGVLLRQLSRSIFPKVSILIGESRLVCILIGVSRLVCMCRVDKRRSLAVACRMGVAYLKGCHNEWLVYSGCHNEWWS